MSQYELHFDSQSTVDKKVAEDEKRKAEQQKTEGDFADLKKEMTHEDLTDAQKQVLLDYLKDIERIGVYGSDDTPLDKFDDKIHTHNKMDEEQILFMMNVSDHCNRPKDMLMFLGEYLKSTLVTTMDVEKTIKGEKKDDMSFEQSQYFVSESIIKFLGNACKKYIEASR